MSIVLNVAALVLFMWLSHRVVTVCWFGAFQHVLTKRLLDKAILPVSERSPLNTKALLIPLFAFVPAAIVFGIACLIPGGLAWIGGSSGVKAALVLGVIELAPSKEGGFSGKGSWTATKWFTEDGSEFFLNWSAVAKQGHFSEKDEGYAEGICEAFGARFERTDRDDDGELEAEE